MSQEVGIETIFSSSSGSVRALTWPTNEGVTIIIPEDRNTPKRTIGMLWEEWDAAVLAVSAVRESESRHLGISPSGT